MAGSVVVEAVTLEREERSFFAAIIVAGLGEGVSRDHSSMRS